MQCVALRSPSAPSLAPRIFSFGSSRFFQNFCARAVFLSRLALACTDFLNAFWNLLNHSLSAVCHLALSHFFGVSLLFFGVSLPLSCVCLLSFCVGILSFCTVVFPCFFLCNILLTVLCSKIIFLCNLIIFKRIAPRFSLFPSTSLWLYYTLFFIVCQHFLSFFDYFFVLYCNL